LCTIGAKNNFMEIEEIDVIKEYQSRRIGSSIIQQIEKNRQGKENDLHSYWHLSKQRRKTLEGLRTLDSHGLHRHRKEDSRTIRTEIR